MASGDHTRAWFPEMLEMLKSRWNSDLDWQACANLCLDMTDYRVKLKKDKGIGPALGKCTECGGRTEIGPAPISIRSLLFALQKNGQISEQQRVELERNWLKFQKQETFDAYGNKK
jgi:hypothetical protein